MILCTIHSLTDEDKQSFQKALKEPIHFVKHFSEATIPLEKISILISFGYDFTLEDLDKMKELKWINILQTGIEHLDIKSILERNILLTHTKDIHGIPISEYVLGVILYNVRDMQRYEFSKQTRLWDRRGISPTEANGKTVSIFGTGSIGQDIAQLLKALQMKIIGVNTSGREVPYFDKVYTIEDKETVLKKSDFVVLIMPATEKTHHCISYSEFKIMKESAYLINVGRGPLVNTEALVDAIHENEIAGAALDVFDNEPLCIESPLWNLRNVHITPHIASLTDKYNERAIEKFLLNYQQFTNHKNLSDQITNTLGY